MAYTDIDKPSDYFETKLWTGNSTDDTAITGLDFAPNWVWIKNRTDTNSHALFDTVRGATKYIESDTTDAEATGATFLKSFTSDGFVLGTGGRVNNNAKLYASWNWKAGTTGSGTTTGTGTGKAYSYSVDTTSGFSIIKYLGNGSAGHTIPHHLGAKADFVIIKGLASGRRWSVGTSSLGWTKELFLEATDAVGTSTAAWNDTAPSSTVITLGTGGNGNTNDETYIMYAFSTKTGYSKFGSYVGNGNADGTFVYTGQKSAFIMVKSTGGESNWQMSDNKRNTFNEVNKHLRANSSGAEFTNYPIDFLSNGFKLRATDTDTNGSGTTYIYMAFASEPFTTSSGVPATAR